MRPTAPIDAGFKIPLATGSWIAGFLDELGPSDNSCSDPETSETRNTPSQKQLLISPVSIQNRYDFPLVIY
jgi:hypothetical protein